MTVPSEAENVVSRFKVLERPTLSPGKCAVCGAVHRPVVDFGLNLMRYGAVMLCEDCVCEAAERVGMVRPEKLAANTLQAGQSVDQYLLERDLTVITNEQYHALTNLVSVLSNGSMPVPRPVGSLSPEAGEGPAEELPGQLRLVFTDDEPDGKGPVGESEAFDL